MYEYILDKNIILLLENIEDFGKLKPIIKNKNKDFNPLKFNYPRLFLNQVIYDY